MSATKPQLSGGEKIGVALLGCGTVGSEVATILRRDHSDLSTRSGASLELLRVGVRDLSRARAGVDKNLLTTDLQSIVKDPAVSVVIEVMGGIEPARTLILEALSQKKSVVTANKALLAKHGAEIFAAAKEHGVDLYYEAAVGGAIPIVRPLRESIVGDSVTRVMGIVNGTTNFILDRMDSTGASFQQALAEATALGYAEADPTADIEAFDAASKAAILASLAFHSEVPVESVHREGITTVTAEQIATAKQSGYTVKLLAVCERVDGGIVARVHPTLIPLSHPLAAVRGAYNAVFVEAESAGQLMFYGAGAGGPETASAVLGDLVSAAKRHLAGGPGLADSIHANLPVMPVQAVLTRYQITLAVSDLPGVLASVASVFASHGVSVETVSQSATGKAAILSVMTHQALEADLERVVAKLRENEAVQDVISVIRVEGI